MRRALPVFLSPPLSYSLQAIYLLIYLLIYLPIICLIIYLFTHFLIYLLPTSLLSLFTPRHPRHPPLAPSTPPSSSPTVNKPAFSAPWRIPPHSTQRHQPHRGMEAASTSDSASSSSVPRRLKSRDAGKPRPENKGCPHPARIRYNGDVGVGRLVCKTRGNG